MSYQMDLENITKGNDDATNFGSMILRFTMKADLDNLRLLRRAFPNAVLTVEEWRKTGEIPDYPYDSPRQKTPEQKDRDRRLVAEARGLLMEDIEKASQVIDWDEGSDPPNGLGKWRELPESSWEAIKRGETPPPCPKDD